MCVEEATDSANKSGNRVQEFAWKENNQHMSQRKHPRTDGDESDEMWPPSFMVHLKHICSKSSSLNINMLNHCLANKFLPCCLFCCTESVFAELLVKVCFLHKTYMWYCTFSSDAYSNYFTQHCFLLLFWSLCLFSYVRTFLYILISKTSTQTQRKRSQTGFKTSKQELCLL